MPLAVGWYIADFDYNERGTGRVVEDFKGYTTPLARWKLRHFELQYGIKVRIIGKRASRAPRSR